MKKISWLFLIVLVLFSCKGEETVIPVNAYVESFTVNGNTVGSGSSTYDLPTDSNVISIRFSSTINQNQWDASKFGISGVSSPEIHFLESTDAQTLTFRLDNALTKFTPYTLTLYSGINLGIKLIDSYLLQGRFNLIRFDRHYDGFYQLHVIFPFLLI